MTEVINIGVVRGGGGRVVYNAFHCVAVIVEGRLFIAWR